jgi:copper transport protein
LSTLRGRRRGSLVAGMLASAWLLVSTSSTSAHALLQSSQPAAGDSLATSPPAITITFGETPDPTLSTISVLDSTGNKVAVGPTQSVDGQPTQLTVSLPVLPSGVYTVSWRTVSTVDGHLATGSFAFGVGVAPPPANPSSGAVAGSSTLTPLAIASRWLLYAGLITLLGACWMLLRGSRPAAPTAADARPLRTITWLAWLAVAVGALAVLFDQLSSAGVAITNIGDTSFATAAVLRAGPLLAGSLAVGWSLVQRDSRWAILAIALSDLAVMLADIALSHAVAGNQPLLDGTIQWLHLAGAGLWVGGLVALLVWLRQRAADQTAADVVRRFSRLATVAIGVVVVTGVLRAVSEVGTVDGLLSTDFGRLVVAKSALLMGLAGLGAINHFISVPRGVAGLPLLRRVGRLEVTLAMLLVLLSAGLVNEAPPAEGATAAAPPMVVASGADFGTTVRVKLTVAPGVAGFDTFSAEVRDYDTGQLVPADAVALRFALPAKPAVGGSRLDLQAQPDGSFSATGTNLSIDGTWSVTAVISHGSSGVEVPLEVTTRVVRQPVDISRQEGLPTIYTIHLDAGLTVQVYLDPGSAGANELHATFFDAVGNELPVPSASMAIGAEGATPTQVTPRMLEPGHFVGDQTLAAGTYLFTVAGQAPAGGGVLVARADVEVSP